MTLIVALAVVLAGEDACTKPNPDALPAETGELETTQSSSTDGSGGTSTDTGDSTTETSETSETSDTGPACETMASGSAPCTDCLEENCCAELTDCAAVSGCSCLSECLSDGTDDITCMLQCPGAALNLPSLLALNDCTQTACGDSGCE